MSFIQRTFEHSEDKAEVKKRFRKMRIVSHLMTHPPSSDKQWYYAGIAADRANFSNAMIHKNDPALANHPLPPSLNRDDAREFLQRDVMKDFSGNATPSDDIKTIPGMTIGLVYVLRLLEVDTVAQMLGKLLIFIDGTVNAKEVLDEYYKWLYNTTRGTIASETNLHTIVSAMGKYASAIWGPGGVR